MNGDGTMQEGLYAATYKLDQERIFGQLEVSTESLHFTSWQKSFKNSERPQRGKVVTRSRVWVPADAVEIHEPWNKEHETRFEMLRETMKRELKEGSYQEKLLLF